MLDASIVKFYATERAYAVADRAVQVFGGMGLLKEGRSSGCCDTCGCSAWSKARAASSSSSSPGPSGSDP